MINRYLYNLLNAGIEQVQEDPKILDELFQDNFVLSDEELSTIKTYFAAHPPNVANGYPRNDSEFPLISITLLSDSEAETFLNEDATMLADTDDPYFGMDIKTAIWEYNYQLMVYTEHPDITAAYYEIMKSILLANLDYLVNLDCFGFSLSGSELAPDLRYLPEHLFVRQITFTCKSEFQRFDKESRWLKAFRVEGIHVDKTASNWDIGNVKSNVTPYTGDE